MLTWLQDFFTWFGTMIESLVSFVVNMVTGLLDLLASIPTILTFLTSSIGHLPPVVLPFATAGITISVVLLVVGRQNNS